MNVIVLGTSAISHTSAISIIRGNMGADSIKLRIVINTEASFFFSRFWKDDRDIGNKMRGMQNCVPFQFGWPSKMGIKIKNRSFFYESPAFNIPYFQRTVNMMDLQPKRSWLCSKPEVTDNMAVRSRRAVLLLSSRRLYITDCKHPVLFPLAILKLVFILFKWRLIPGHFKWLKQIISESL